MVTENVRELIEIPEDAYKQNAVYRPWPEDKVSKTVGSLDKGHFEVMPAECKRTAMSYKRTNGLHSSIGLRISVKLDSDSGLVEGQLQRRWKIYAMRRC